MGIFPVGEGLGS